MLVSFSPVSDKNTPSDSSTKIPCVRMRLEEKLTALRREHKMTQAELAEALDVSRQAVSKWERGIASPSMENLVYVLGPRFHLRQINVFVC